MTRPLSFALIGDGTSDQALAWIITWAIRRLHPDATLRNVGFSARRGRSLVETVQSAASELKPDLLFVHRDAERVPLAERREEIPEETGVVKVVPVRMTEAWLLIDIEAIRCAAGNPNGTIGLDLPPVQKLERLPDPKGLLQKLLVEASELQSPRRKKRFKRDLGQLVQRVAARIGDFSVLDRLDAYRVFESDLRTALQIG